MTRKKSTAEKKPPAVKKPPVKKSPGDTVKIKGKHKFIDQDQEGTGQAWERGEGVECGVDESE